MVVIQNVLVPYMSTFAASPDNISGEIMLGVSEAVKIEFTSMFDFFYSLGKWFVSFHGILLVLSMLQGFFAGLVMGKLAEGELKYGYRHSLILVTLAFFIITLAQGLVK